MWYRDSGVMSAGALLLEALMPAKLHLARLSCKIRLETSRLRNECGGHDAVSKGSIGSK